MTDWGFCLFGKLLMILYAELLKHVLQAVVAAAALAAAGPSSATWPLLGATVAAATLAESANSTCVQGRGGA